MTDDGDDGRALALAVATLAGVLGWAVAAIAIWWIANV